MDDAQRLQRVSRFVARHLRHTPEEIGLALGPGGWVPVADLLRGARDAGFPITREELDAVVAEPTKRRYAYDTHQTRIRAVQGHSVAVEMHYTPVQPPATLFHGTHPGALGKIFREGLRPMRRQFVHLSADVDTATTVGARRGTPIILAVDSAAMHAAGTPFYRAENGVWLTDSVAACFLRRA